MKHQTSGCLVKLHSAPRKILDNDGQSVSKSELSFGWHVVIA